MLRAVFATDAQGGIAYQNHLPWPRDREDSSHFRNLTLSQIVIMGRKTWESLDMPAPLPGRINVVVSRCEYFSTSLPHPDVVICPSQFSEGVQLLHEHYPDQQCWVIGGASTLQLAKPYISEIFLTVFNDIYACDSRINTVDYLEKFHCDNVEICDNKQFQTWRRRL